MTSPVLLFLTGVLAGLVAGFFLSPLIRRSGHGASQEELRNLRQQVKQSSDLNRNLQAQLEEQREQVNAAHIDGATNRAKVTSLIDQVEALKADLSISREEIVILQGRSSDLQASLAGAQEQLRSQDAWKEEFVQNKTESRAQNELNTELQALLAQTKEQLSSQDALKKELEIKRLDSEKLQVELAETKEKLRSEAAQKLYLEEARNDLKTQFEALSAEMLKSSREELLTMARNTITDPFSVHVKGLQEKIEELQKNSLQRLDVLQSTSRDLIQKSSDVQGAAQELSSALRSPNVKGRWGEVSLRRILEFVGMLNYCDFDEQVHIAGEQRSYRPDCVITIPGDKRLVIDAKAPLDRYFDSLKSADENAKRVALLEHVKKVKSHVDGLSKKDYAGQLSGKGQIIDGVILFIPVEGALSLALEMDPGLLEYAFDQKIILTFPTSLLAILKGLSMTIQQQEVARNIDEIKANAQELYRRFGKFSELFAKLGSRINQVNIDYNNAVGSFNSRLLPQARRFAQLGGIESQAASIEQVDHQARLPEGS